MRLLVIVFILVFSNCGDEYSAGIAPETSRSDISVPTNTDQPKETVLPVLDTTIRLKGIKRFGLNDDKLSVELAQRELYKYYKKQGIVSRGNLAITALNASDRICVDYDTMYSIQINKVSVAVISYWLGACDLNGTGFRPTRAILLSTNFGYRFTNVEFIPRSFVIDSIAKAEIFGYDYEAGEPGIKRRFKITLKD